MVPNDIALDAEGRIYVADQAAGRIVRMDDMDGTGWVTFGTTGSGRGEFKEPSGIAVDAAGRIFVVDSRNARIVRVDDMSGAGWIEFPRRGRSERRAPAARPCAGSPSRSGDAEGAA